VRYTLLIYTDAAAWRATSEEDQNAIMGEYLAFTRAIRETGEYGGGEALQPVETATTVRAPEGHPVTTDGPFAETKEMLGGFYIVDVETRQRAEELAGQIPDVPRGLGSVEVRPILEYPEDEG
jgi:hypothetical protein